MIPRPGLDVEVHVAWLLPPQRLITGIAADPLRIVVEPAGDVPLEQAPIVDFRGPAATAAGVLRAVADQLDPPAAAGAAGRAAAWIDTVQRAGRTTPEAGQ